MKRLETLNLFRPHIYEFPDEPDRLKEYEPMAKKLRFDPLYKSL